MFGLLLNSTAQAPLKMCPWWNAWLSSVKAASQQRHMGKSGSEHVDSTQIGNESYMTFMRGQLLYKSAENLSQWLGIFKDLTVDIFPVWVIFPNFQKQMSPPLTSWVWHTSVIISQCWWPLQLLSHTFCSKLKWIKCCQSAGRLFLIHNAPVEIPNTGLQRNKGPVHLGQGVPSKNTHQSSRITSPSAYLIGTQERQKERES